eukprot:TRINITY_DN94150_c0_g1_i1.p1 TRINITY_DN94150_c0_g1~~TRINITY_DN94150_c0_g1_i1.p1  ORF type:complete len:303 (-),score=40.33 TRINITY_DN94150_c0_g1_i1:106-1014(-)
MQPSYGAAPYAADFGVGKSSFGRQRKSINFSALLVCLLLPWIIFVAVFSVNSLSIHYSSPVICTVTEGVSGLIIATLLYTAFQKYKSSANDSSQYSWYIFLFVTSTIALIFGMILGNENYVENTMPYMDAMQLNLYSNVDPSAYKGNQLMDAGRIHFAEGTKLDLTKSMGFKNLNNYCVAPITFKNKQLQNYDFWAVGLNCCSGHMADFHCGEYNNPAAHSGLRLMRDDLRSYFRLAVQQAEAAYNINANHPVFLYWMQDPLTELVAFQNKGMSYWLTGLFVALGIQFLLVVVATIFFAKGA